MIVLVWQESEPAHHLLGFCNASSIDDAAKKLGLKPSDRPTEQFPWRNSIGQHISLSKIKEIKEGDLF
jgi:hypothetical protein